MAKIISEEVRSVLDVLESFRQKKELSRPEMARELGIPYETFRCWFRKGKKAAKPSEENLSRIQTFLAENAQLIPLPQGVLSEARRKIERLKVLLSIALEELAWFRDNSKEVREIYRREFDQFDTGYLASLLTMLPEEGKFQRWREMTTHQFNYFKKKGG